MAIPDRKELTELYHAQEMTVEEVAENYNRAYSTVHEWFRKKGIDTRQRGGRPSKTRKKQRRIHRIRTEVPCSECGYNAHPAATDFHHIKGEKVANVSDMTTYSWEKIGEEIKKCKVVCANCHRVIEDETKDETNSR